MSLSERIERSQILHSSFILQMENEIKSYFFLNHFIVTHLPLWRTKTEDKKIFFRHGASYQFTKDILSKSESWHQDLHQKNENFRILRPQIKSKAF